MEKERLRGKGKTIIVPSSSLYNGVSKVLKVIKPANAAAASNGKGPKLMVLKGAVLKKSVTDNFDR